MKIVLTGGIACGKSLVAKFLRELGVLVLDADDVVHELEAPGGAAVPAIVARFGKSVLSPDGGIDRKKLAALVFAAAAARRDLEAIIHPLVRQRLLDFVSDQMVGPPRRGGRHGTPITFHCSPLSERALPDEPLAARPLLRITVIPLLFESHFESDYDIILCVASSEDRQIERMMRTRGYTRAQAEARLVAQMPVHEKAVRADRIIHNDSTPEDLKAEVQRCVAWLQDRLEKAT